MYKQILKCKPFSCLLFRREASNGRISIIGVPFSKGQPRGGTEKAPEIMRNAGIINEIQSLGHDVKDCGDISLDNTEVTMIQGTVKNLPQVAACAEKLSKKVMEVILENRIAFTIGGDHSVALGSIDGHIQAKAGNGDNVSVLWVDAHPDINTATSSPSGNAHGIPLSLLVKELEGHRPKHAGLEWQTPRLPINNIAFIGLRDLDKFERDTLKKFNVTAFDMDDIDRHGIREVTRMALERINPEGKNSLHVSFDIDSLDVHEAPSTGTPVRGGLTLREAQQIMEAVHRTGTLTALDLVEINPLLGSESDVRRTVQAAVHVVRSAFGRCRSDSAPAHFKL